MALQRNNQQRSILVVMVVVGLAFVTVLVLSGGDFSFLTSNKNVLPPLSERINPQPLSASQVYIDGEVQPGKSVTIDRVNLERDGYIVIYDDKGGVIAELGRSPTLKAGSHGNVLVQLGKSTKDGDVILIKLVAADNEEIKAINGDPVQLQKNVGMVVSHYEDEY